MKDAVRHSRSGGSRRRLRQAAAAVCRALAPLALAVAATEPAPAAHGLIIEHAEGEHRVMPPRANTPTTKGVSLFDEDAGVTITRLSEANETKVWPMQVSSAHVGLINGYAKYSSENIDGTLAFAVSTKPGLVVYDLENLRMIRQAWSNARGGWVEEGSNPRWDSSGRPGTASTIYYSVGAALYAQDVLTGKEREIWRLPAETGPKAHIIPDDHQDQSPRYRPARWVNGATKEKGTCVVDLWEGKTVGPSIIFADSLDISPDGRWVMANQSSAVWFYDVEALKAGRIERVKLPDREVGHDGWAWDAEGNASYVWQSNHTDYMRSFAPATRMVYDIIYLGRMDWPNQHPIKIANPEIRGWIGVSTYADPKYLGKWAHGQLMFIEMLPEPQQPRVWRLGSNDTMWSLEDKGRWYFAEAFASLNFAGNALYWGCNAFGKATLELTRMQLPADCWQRLGMRRPAERRAPNAAGVWKPGETIEAEDYDLGGARWAYWDETPRNEGRARYRAEEGVDIDAWFGRRYISRCSRWEWTGYSIAVDAPATYTLKLDYALDEETTEPRQVLIQCGYYGNADRPEVKIATPPTGGRWAEATAQVWLDPSIRQVRLAPQGYELRLDRFVIEKP